MPNLLLDRISKFYKLLIWVLLSLQLIACGSGGSGGGIVAIEPPPPPSPCGTFSAVDQCKSLQVSNSVERHFVFHEPVNRIDLAPIVIFLHGGGRTPQTITDYVDAISFADDMGYLAVLPVGGNGLSWSSIVAATAEISEDSQLVSAIIDQLVTENQADPDRVYVVGYSAGSYMSYQLACEIPEKVKGMVTIAGTLRGDLQACNAAFPVAVHHIQGTADNYDGGADDAASVQDTINLWAEVNACDGTTTDSTAFSLTLDGNLATTTSYNGCLQPLSNTKILDGSHNQIFDTEVLHQLMKDLMQ